MEKGVMMNDLERAIEQLKFEMSLSKSQKAGKMVLGLVASILATAMTAAAFDGAVKAIRNRKS